MKRLSTVGSVGNRWYKVNLHVHGEGNNPAELVAAARDAGIDLLAVTDHQTFDYYTEIAVAASSAGRPLTVLPGIEITTHEGLHLLAVFSPDFSQKCREQFIGWLQIPGTGDTRIASKRTVDDILLHVEEENGVVIVPHPWTHKIGLLGGSPKVETRARWLETGRIKLIQIPEEKWNEIRYIGHDGAGRWVNRFVLRTASEAQIAESTYCLAPFNRTDAKRPEEIGNGCSWFRMQYPSVDGLRQVACEPRTRISIREPVLIRHDCIHTVRVRGGYCDGQTFCFNESLNCIIGDNHAGKSAVFDLIRFVLGHVETSSDARSRTTLLRRLNRILQPEGTVEVFLRNQDDLYVVERTFRPITSGTGDSVQVIGCQDSSMAYLYDPTSEELLPADDFVFPLEVYEQGRIGQLRDDIARQLEMLDEFAGLAKPKEDRNSVLQQFDTSAASLKPLYEERERLQSEVSQLPNLETELKMHEEQLPDEKAETEWATTTAIAQGIIQAVDAISSAALSIPVPKETDRLHDPEDPLVNLFLQTLPEIPAEGVAEGELIREWRTKIEDSLKTIEAARVALANAAKSVSSVDKPYRKQWTEKHENYERHISTRLAQIGIESPKQLRRQVNSLRTKVRQIKTQTQPRLAIVNREIGRLETERQNLRTQLRKLNDTITAARKAKAQELTQSLGGHIVVSLQEQGDRSEYLNVLREICVEIASQQHRIQNREPQLQSIVNNVTPLDLAEALRNSGRLTREGQDTNLVELCGVTLNTQNILSGIANDILLLNRLETVNVPDVPKIKVRREGEENNYADLATGLSPGEQSAAILTLALQTRSRPLILDQPEDELGYAYVVNLIVPKVLDAKFLRQLLVATHVANIPVLGDADYIIRMENRTNPETVRQCSVSVEGCFERAEVTKAVVQLEGGEEAFRFRQHRYSLANAGSRATTPVTTEQRGADRVYAGEVEGR